MTKKPLSQREIRTLGAAAECILPPGGPFLYGHADIDYVAWVNDFLAIVPRQVNWAIHVILWFLEYAGWLFVGVPKRFSRLAVSRREQVFERMRRSNIYVVRGMLILLSSILLIPFYNDRRVMDAIGYGGYKEGANKLNGAAS